MCRQIKKPPSASSLACARRDCPTNGGDAYRHPPVTHFTSRPDSVISKCRRSRRPIPTQIATAPMVKSKILKRRIPFLLRADEVIE